MPTPTPRAFAAFAVAIIALALAALAITAEPNRIDGTAEDDVLTGTPGPDTIDGLEGDDTIDGGTGDDTLTGGPGRDRILSGGGNDLIELRDGERDVALCADGGDPVVGADQFDRAGNCDHVVGGSGPLRRIVVSPPRSAAPLHIVYDFANIAHALHAGGRGLAGLGSVRTTARQFPLGDPFPRDRWIGKVGHSEIRVLGPAAIARLLETRMRTSRFGGLLQADLVAIDEVGIDAQDDGFGPRLLTAMKILAKRRHAPTGERMSQRVLFYAAPKMVANVGEPNDREDWDSAVAAARLSGGVYLQMYHAAEGRVTSVATEAEWRTYLPTWRREMGPAAGRLRVIMTRQPGVSQDAQWRWARQTDAGRRALRAGAAVYRLGTVAEARASLRNWNAHAR